MKVVDVSPFHDGLRRNNTMLNRLENEMKAIETAVEGLVAMEDSLKGQGGDAIRAFYAECHLPFLQFFMTFKSIYVNVLTQMDSALDALEPDANGFIRETFLEGEVEAGLTEISQLTSSLTDEANDIMNQVADIVALPHLNDSDVQEGVRDARRKRDHTIADLYEFDANQMRALMTIENDLSIMETWLADIESLFKGGLTGVHFESKQWAAITLNSGLQTAIDQQTSAVAGGLGNSDQDNLIGTEIKAGAFQALESKRAETIERGAYGSYNLLKFHIYENGLIIKEYQLGTRKPIQYEVVKEVEKEFDDGGVRELDNYFEGTKLAFVDYIHPRAIVQKGFKKMALAIVPGAKPSKYKGNLPVKKTHAVENKSKGAGEVSKSTSGNRKHLSDVKIPSVRNNEFNKWFDNLSAKKIDEMWNNPQLRSKIEDRIRRPGGYHEWHLVARTPKFKQWGISMDDIKDMRSLTKDVEFVNPPGRHGSRGSTKAHNEMLKIIDSASDYESFVKGLNEWAENRMKNGIMDLPEGLRR
ncbi:MULTISPECIES: ribonuclease YeeF family protein [Sporosarcina]|uniref:ribonuclease YeeF family protein n=1 Tax=Sporosarcina TaxID=1569 RepID=UPI0030D3796A